MTIERLAHIPNIIANASATQFSRRDVIKRGSIVALAIPTVSALLAACEGPDDADDEDVAAEQTDDEEPIDEPDVDDASEGDPMEVSEEDVDIGSHLIGELEGPEVVDEMPDSFSESPDLAERVEAGEIPPVEERIGSQPMVVRPVHEIGEYGGTWRRAFTGPADHENGGRINSSDKPLFFDYSGVSVEQSLARDWEISDEGRVTTLYLREGLRWSDGEPFTSADFMWWFEHMYENQELMPSKNSETAINGQQGYMEADGDYTIHFIFPEPYPLFADVLAGDSMIGGGHASKGRYLMGAYAPGHYLEQFHADFIGEEEAEEQAQAAGYDNWLTYFQFLNDWSLNVDLPVVTPWKTTSPINEPNWVMERNPYYWAVDTDGNQLPYIDQIVMRNAEDVEVITLRMISGEIDKQARFAQLPSLPVFLENQEAGGYTVHLDQSSNGSDALFYFNFSYTDDDEIADLFNERDFRRALSLGIERDQINEAIFLGLGTPGSVIPAEHMPQNPGESEWRTKWSHLDPELANELLDGLGLDERDNEGYRLRRDNGERLRIQVATSVDRANMGEAAEMVSFHLGEHLGIQLTLQEVDRSLFVERVATNQMQMTVWGNGGSEQLFLWPRQTLPTLSYEGFMGPQLAVWWETDGEEGMEPNDEIKHALDLFRSAFGMEDEDERNEVAQEIWKIAVDEQWYIGTIGLTAGVRIVGNHMGNIPERQSTAQHTRTPAGSHPPTFFMRSS